jgi:hypothetical protein
MPIGNEDLTPEQFEELDMLRDRIEARLRDNNHLVPEDDYPMIDVNHAYHDYDLDLVRAYDKLLHGMGYVTAPIEAAVIFLHETGNHEAAAWLTAEHVTAYNRLDRAVVSESLRIARTDNGGFSTLWGQGVRSLAFTYPSDTALIESIIRDRGVAKAHEIESILKELKRGSYHPATLAGAL